MYKLEQHQAQPEVAKLYLSCTKTMTLSVIFQISPFARLVHPHGLI